MNERLWNKMNSLESEFANIKHQIVPELLFSNDSKDNAFLELLPFSTVESILACEKLLQSDDSVKEKFVCLYTNLNQLLLLFNFEFI